jgi:hypothetical protein
MPIDVSEMVFYLSGGSSNTDPNLSLGGGISTTPLNADDSNTIRLQNLFANRTIAQAKAGGRFHRCIFLKNNNTTLTATNMRIWQSDINPTTEALFIAIGATGLGEKGNAIGPIANEITLPWISTTARFHAYLDAAHFGIIPDLAPTEYIAIWLQLKLPANMALVNNDMFGLMISYTTPA